MAVPVLESYTLANTSGGSSLVIAKPAGVVEGDLLVMICAISTTTTFSSTGFTGLYSVIESMRLMARRKIATGSEPSTYTIDLAAGNPGVAAFLLRISGAEDPAVNDFDFGTNSSASANNLDAPSVVTDTDDSLVIRAAAIEGGIVNTLPDTEVDTQGTGSGDDLGVTQKNQAVAGATGVGNFGFSATSNCVAFTLAIAPPDEESSSSQSAEASSSSSSPSTSSLSTSSSPATSSSSSSSASTSSSPATSSSASSSSSSPATSSSPSSSSSSPATSSSSSSSSPSSSSSSPATSSSSSISSSSSSPATSSSSSFSISYVINRKLYFGQTVHRVKIFPRYFMNK